MSHTPDAHTPPFAPAGFPAKPARSGAGLQPSYKRLRHPVWGGASLRSSGGRGCRPRDGSGLVLMDPAEVPDQLEPRRRAARDHQPAFWPGGERRVEKADTQKQQPSFLPLFERCCCTPSPPVIRVAPDPPRSVLDRHPGDRPQVAVRGSAHRRFRARLVLRGLLRLSRSNAHDVVEGTYVDDPGPIGSFRKLRVWAVVKVRSPHTVPGISYTYGH